MVLCVRVCLRLASESHCERGGEGNREKKIGKNTNFSVNAQDVVWMQEIELSRSDMNLNLDWELSADTPK